MQDLKIAKKRKASGKKRKKTGFKPDIGKFFKRGAGFIVMVAAVASSVFVIQGFWVFLTTASYFGLSEIGIKGNAIVSRRDIISAAGVNVGSNIFSFDMEEMGSRIEDIPWVREVSVERRFPASLNIEIRERTPFALIKLKDLYYVDEESYIFAKADADKGLDFPIISGVDINGILEGDKQAFGLLRKGIDFLQDTRHRNGLIRWDTLSEIVVDKDGGITVYPIKVPAPIYLGGGNFDERLNRADKVLADLAKKGIKVRKVDMDYKDRALVKVSI